jgi:hypothetical protein
LFDEHADNLKRPDFAGYIVDPMLDTILANDVPLDCLQIWIDPKRPDAHTAPELRAYVARIAEVYRFPALIRHGSRDGFLLVAPCLDEGGQWLEIRGNMNSEADMRAKVAAALAAEAAAG